MIRHKAEELFLKTVRNYAKSHPTHRCLFLKFSQLDMEPHEWEADLYDSLRTQYYEDYGQIYLCNDNDLFIIGRPWTYKHLKKFLAHLAPKLTPASNLERLASLFEIGVDAYRLEEICRSKMNNPTNTTQPAPPKQVKPPTQIREERCNAAFGALDPFLISTIASRRASRTECEILVVEDDPFSRKLVSIALEKRYTLSMTQDGQGAILNYINKAPDVLFLDIGLPDIDGHKVLKKLFEIDPNAYVVMFSGNGDRENVLKAIERGAKGFVGKPFTQEKLVQYIHKSPFVRAKQKDYALITTAS